MTFNVDFKTDKKKRYNNQSNVRVMQNNVQVISVSGFSPLK